MPRSVYYRKKSTTECQFYYPKCQSSKGYPIFVSFLVIMVILLVGLCGYCSAGQLKRPATSEHLTPKDVVITAAPAEASLAMFLKGQPLIANKSTILIRGYDYHIGENIWRF